MNDVEKFGMVLSPNPCIHGLTSMDCGMEGMERTKGQIERIGAYEQRIIDMIMTKSTNQTVKGTSFG